QNRLACDRLTSASESPPASLKLQPTLTDRARFKPRRHRNSRNFTWHRAFSQVQEIKYGALGFSAKRIAAVLLMIQAEHRTANSETGSTWSGHHQRSIQGRNKDNASKFDFASRRPLRRPVRSPAAGPGRGGHVAHAS